jgi:transposase
MCDQYGDKVLSRRVVYEWIEMFENGCTSVTDAERSGCPATATTKRNGERTRELIRENRRITVEEVAGRLDVGVGYGYSTIHDSPNFSKVCQVGA